MQTGAILYVLPGVAVQTNGWQIQKMKDHRLRHVSIFDGFLYLI